MKRVLLACLLFGLAVGCSRPSEPVATPSAAVKVRVGVVPSLLFAPLYVAIDRGYLKSAAIEVDIQPIKAGQDAIAFLANDQLDFVLAGYSAALFNASARGLDVRIIAPMGIQPTVGDASPLVARPSLKTVGDLKGRKVAVPGGAGSAGSFLVALRLQTAGLSLNDVELINLGLPDQPAALASGSVDAAQMAEPYASEALAKHDGIALAPGMLAGVNASGMLTSRVMLDKKNAVVVAFTAALMHAARDLQSGALPAAERDAIFAHYTHLSPAQLGRVVPYDFSPDFDLSVTRRDLEAMQRIMTTAGILKLDHPIEVDRLVDAAPAAAAVRLQASPSNLRQKRHSRLTTCGRLLRAYLPRLGRACSQAPK